MHRSQTIPLAELAGLEQQWSDEERLVQQTVKRFVAERYLPQATTCFDEGRFPHHLVPELAALGLLGAPYHGYGCAGMRAVAYGLAMQELEYGDSALRSFVSVQNGLCMYPILRYGSDEQKDAWLPRMARGEAIGCFGLTEPDAGSDPSALRTRAVRNGDELVLHGNKMWITNAQSADVAIIWAKLEGDASGDIRGILVESDRAGYSAPPIKHKLSLRASETGEIVLDACRVPATNLLPGALGLGAALSCLNQARFGIAFGAVGAAWACFETALRYAQERVQFGAPIARKQLVQAKLAEMAQEIIKAQLMIVHFGRLKERGGEFGDAGNAVADGDGGEDLESGPSGNSGLSGNTGGEGLSPWQVSLAKRNNVAMAIDVARTARSIMGAAGLTSEYPVMRHMLNFETLFTYEGTDDVHALILGRALTGENAF